MYDSQQLFPGTALAITCVVSLLTLSAPQVVTADGWYREGVRVRQAVLPTAESHRLEVALPRQAAFVLGDQATPVAHMALQPTHQGAVSVQQQVPEALLRSLLTEERAQGTVELQVPEALLRRLLTEGHMETP